MAANRELTVSEELFVAEYVANGFVATAAYRVAYPNANEKTAKGESHKVVRRPQVRDAVMAVMNEHLGDINELAAKSLMKLEQIAFAEKGDEYYGSASQLKAIELIQKQLGLQTQNIKAQVEASTIIEINIVGEADVDADKS